MRILVVDDSPAIRARLLAMLVELPGVEVREAAGADEAMESIQVSAPDLVVLDLHMPGKTGLELLPQIKSLPVVPIVVMMTGEATEHHRRTCLALGADFFFDKSRDFARMLELVRVGEI
ncbi:MAG: response regulator [Polyangiaceae bacterium]